MDEIVSINWNNLTTAQMIYVRAVVMDEIECVLYKHMNTIFELGFKTEREVEELWKQNL